jgi:phage terminase Nu1 subunit (DNA packaging protein)
MQFGCSEEKATMEQTPKYIKDKKVAEMTDLSVQTLRNDRYKGKGIPYSKRGRAVRYRVDDVIAYMEARKIQTSNEREGTTHTDEEE